LLVVDVGHRRTDILGIIGGRAVFARTISHGGSDVTAALATAFRVPADRAEAFKHAQGTLHAPDVPPVDAGAPRVHEVVRAAVDPFVRDLKQSIASATVAIGLAPVGVALCGGGARLRGLADWMEAALKIPVSPLDPPTLAEPIDAERFGLFGKALGLALRSATRAPRIDLRRGSFAVQADARALRGRVFASAGLLLLVVVAWGFSAVSRYAVLQVEADHQRERLKAVTKELLGEEIDDFERAEALAKGTGELQDPMPEMDAFAVLDSLSRRIPEEIQHDVDELDISPDRAELRGLVDSLADVDKVYDAISEEPCFPVVNRGKTTRNTSDGRQKYQLDVEIHCPSESDAAAPGGTARPGATRPSESEGN
jgi:Tfp pilus assembly protein PilN